jgi:tetratricopeptide (TPR) repeat protein
VGRDQKLTELHAQLQQNESSAPRVRLAITAIAGMGGIGKTELALQYAIAQLQQGHYPAGLCWLRARDQEIATQIVTFAQAHLGFLLPEQLEIKAQVRFCWQQWPEGEALIVLDDVTDYKAIEPYLPPSDPRFKLLITTRLKLGSSVKDFPVEELDEGSAIALLESLVKDGRIQSQLDDAKALCKWVGYLPLALELLGRYLARKPDWSILRLLNALEDKRLEANALIAPETGMTGQLGVAAALELSWQELDEAEQELACVLGMFAIAPIPWSLLEQCHSEVDPNELEETRDDGLIARSLMKRIGEGNYQLHQIVQEYFRIKLEQKSDQGQEIKRRFCQVMVAIAQSIDETQTIDEIDRVRNAIIHLEEVASRWIESLTREDLIWPFVGVGRFYEGQRNYGFAEPWRRKCLEVCQKLLGQEHPYIADSIVHLADLYGAQLRYEESEVLYLQALQMFQNVFGQEHPSVATCFKNLAHLYENQGRYEESEVLYLQALQMFQNVLGQENPTVATCLGGLASLYCRQGYYEEPEALYLQSIQIYQKQLGQENPSVATCFQNLAYLYETQVRYEESEALYLQALQMFQNVLGQKHPSVADCLVNFATFYQNQGRYEEAEPLYLQALQIYQTPLGQEHPHVADCLVKFADLYAAQGRYEETEPLYLQALQIYQKQLGEEHPYVEICLDNLADLYAAQGRFEETEPLYLQALQIFQNQFGQEHPSVAMRQWHLGVFYQRQGRYDEAEDLYLKAIVIAEKKLGASHRLAQVIRHWLESLPEY